MATMDDKQLRRLSRRDLLGLLEELSRENDRLRAELDEANRKLEDRCVRLQRCGSMAEAALELGGVFEAADRAVDIYRQSVEEAAQSQGQQPAQSQGQQPAQPQGQQPVPPAGQHSGSGSRRADANH